MKKKETPVKGTKPFKGQLLTLKGKVVGRKTHEGKVETTPGRSIKAKNEIVASHNKEKAIYAEKRKGAQTDATKFKSKRKK